MSKEKVLAHIEAPLMYLIIIIYFFCSFSFLFIFFKFFFEGGYFLKYFVNFFYFLHAYCLISCRFLKAKNVFMDMLNKARGQNPSDTTQEMAKGLERSRSVS